MKIMIIAIAVAASTCTKTPKEKKVQDWIKKAHRPIEVKRNGWSPNGGTVYHLTAADGQELITPMVNLSLGDTLR